MSREGLNKSTWLDPARFCGRSRPWAGWQSQPGLRPEYHEYYYGAYFRVPDGNKLCVACHSPQG